MSVPFYMILNTLPLRVDMLVIKKKNGNYSVQLKTLAVLSVRT